MFIKSTTDTNLLISVFDNYFNSDESRVQKLNAIARLTAFKSWSELKQFIALPFIQKLNDDMVSAFNKEKSVTGLFPSPYCLRMSMICTVMQIGNADRQLKTLRVLNLFTYVAFHGALNTLQKFAKNHSLVKLDDRPSLAVGYDLRKYTIANLNNQINFLYTTPLEITNFINGEDIFVSLNRIKTIIELDQRIFHDIDKTKSLLPAYWETHNKMQVSLKEALRSSAITHYSHAIEIHVYLRAEVQKDTDLDVGEHYSTSFRLIPLQSGSFGLIKRMNHQGVIQEYNEQEMLDIKLWCTDDYLMAPSKLEIGNCDEDVIPH